MNKKNYTSIKDLLEKNKKISLPKEAEPIAAEKFEIKEPSEDNIEEEVRPFVSPRAETIELPPDLKKMGLQAVSQSQFSDYKNIKLPISDEKIVVGQKAPITSSIRWLAAFALYILAQAHLGLKVIHGHVIRVLKR
ncbi:hypothetical protein CO165_02140 [Candidatus Roizmanbacteria bacterium CG_4_9_14_3_um_filter_33_18]|uniref:Uncharacterized protein n=3 Tax=Candidatus Roizmaniibacteriota TaxID=1752723 RepID=A0A2M7UB37_9BACT|nr:MAG: hypothetical protein COW97_03095 [Candidatus Roizmanbacteria bacterium CG22_combo_CG10-13_8_21_14_all_34_12]PIZ68428.1 MAG: hypothetical protein COY12_00175 [Candidatus Roizmanbacteria bacterium CG_4_10_14_0_2_um_filter_33_96]PJA55712.1 MAG: hypothetical protein CO165_02140 [Candidatus Roizmanbacteria bacterium CG_4_9_14_3_um_filter_33_18]